MGYSILAMGKSAEVGQQERDDECCRGVSGT
jgi:hypothetical protein